MSKNLNGKNHNGKPQAAYPHKIHISAYRILFVLKLFSENYRWVLNHLNNELQKNPTIRRGFAGETLLKHLHTFQRAGYQLKREWVEGQWVYTMTEHPLKLHLDNTNKNILVKLSNNLKFKPFLNDYRSFVSFIYNLVSQQLFVKTHLETPWLDDGLADELTEEVSNKIQVFERYIQDNQTLELGYRDCPGNALQVVRVEPLAIGILQNQLCLVARDTKTLKKDRFVLENIVTHRQLPTQSRWQSNFTTVTFILSGRVAKNYRKFPNEQVQEKDSVLIVRHTTDDLDRLYLRLLKYGKDCQIMSPQSCIDQFVALLDSHINNVYSPPTTPL